MPIPLIAALVAGTGLSAGRQVFTRRKRKKFEGLFKETLSSAERLDPGQRKLIQGVFAINPGEGLDLLNDSLARNLQRDQLKQAAAFQTENVRDRRDNLALRTREADQKLRELNQATDPRVTGAALARQGLKVIGSREDILAGNFEVAPVPGSKPWGEAVAGFRSVERSLANANDLVESIATHGAVTNLSDPESAKQAFAFQRMIAGMKTILETGALAEFEAEMVQRAIIDPQSLFNEFMGGGSDKALLTATLFRDLVAKDGERQLRDTEHFQFDAEDVQGMQRNLGRARAARPVFIDQASGATAGPGEIPIAAGAGTTVGDALHRLMIQAEIIGANKRGDVQGSADAMTRLRELQRQGEELGAGRATLPGGEFVQGLGRGVFDLIKAF